VDFTGVCFRGARALVVEAQDHEVMRAPDPTPQAVVEREVQGMNDSAQEKRVNPNAAGAFAEPTE
jgi:hypothetical protein